MILDRINGIKISNIRILDLGSGNARFYDYLKINLNKHFDYLGLDQSNLLMQEACEKYSGDKNFKQQKLDIITDLDKIEGLYDVVVAFGLTHHIPSVTIRHDWFNKVGKLVAGGGLLALTFWIMEKPYEQKGAGIDITELDQGDTFLGWKKTKDAVRFAHLYNTSEINDVISIQKQNKLQLKQKFYSDKSKKSSNLNLIFQKA